MNTFLQTYIPPNLTQSGRLINLENGEDFGKRNFSQFTKVAGQPTKMFVPGKRHIGKICILEHCQKSGNTVVVQSAKHPALFTNTLTVENISYTMSNMPIDINNGECKYFTVAFQQFAAHLGYLQ